VQGTAAFQANGVMDDETKQSAVDRIRRLWPICVVGFGLIATLAWIAALGWLLYQFLVTFTR